MMMQSIYAVKSVELSFGQFLGDLNEIWYKSRVPKVLWNTKSHLDKKYDIDKGLFHWQGRKGSLKRGFKKWAFL